MQVTVTGGAEWRATSPVQIVPARYYTQHEIETGRLYDVDRTGSRFLMLKEDGQAPPVNFVVLQNWTEELKRLVPAR